MKKIFLLLFALFLFGCDPGVITETKTVYVEVIPEDPTIPDNQNVIGRWYRSTMLWDFNADYSFTCYDPNDLDHTVGDSVLFYGTYEMTERIDGDGVTLTDGESFNTLFYYLEILEDYPGYRDITMNMKPDGGTLWVEYEKVADE